MSGEYAKFTEQYADPADEFRVPVWDRVTADWDVLILWPWQWPQAHHYRWDQAWDCPSGVVFTPGAIVYHAPERRLSAATAGVDSEDLYHLKMP